ncbi:MAG: GTPase [Prochlorococcus sp. SP3034]|nr:GTPase [Prochlorococcus sp. SP3034]|tara:strand:- start:5879 stop:7381 length:1503 start_codon:yes stop_codon:yes gene_type:complete
MYKFLIKYNYYIISSILILIIINIIRNLINIYTLILFFSLIFYLYKTNKRLVKRIILKIFYNNKPIIRLNNKFSAAKKSLIGISEIKKLIKDNVNAEIINYKKIKIEKQLKAGNYKVILFGASSSGKTSLARVILKRMIGETSPTYGTTKKITEYSINISFLKRKINIIDTPGLFEASTQGAERERDTIYNASKSDLIIFVVDQDLNKYELYLLKELIKIGKSIIIVLNKCDLRSLKENNIIKENIINLISEFSRDIKVIKTIASPQSVPNNKNKPSKKRIEVDSLFTEILHILEREGEELLADNILFQCNELGSFSKNIINNQREQSARKVINRYSWITSSVILVNPLPAIDYLATSTINIQMILEMAKVYECKISKENASELTKSIISVLATLGIVKGGLNLITNILSLNFTTLFINKSAQAITSAWIIRIVGLSFIKYFQQNQSWGDDGIHEVVQNIYNINKKEELLDEFIKEAINKLKKNKNFSKSKKLPPYFLKG